MEQFEHNGYRIRVTPYEPTEGWWVPKARIFRGTETKPQIVEEPDELLTKQEACERAVELAKEWIDKNSNLSQSDRP